MNVFKISSRDTLIWISTIVGRKENRTLIPNDNQLFQGSSDSGVVAPPVRTVSVCGQKQSVRDMGRLVTRLGLSTAPH